MDHQMTLRDKLWGALFLVAVLTTGVAMAGILVMVSPLAGLWPVSRSGVWLPEGPLAIGGLALLGLVGLGWSGVLFERA